MVREDGGTVELLRIEKQGQTEIPVGITFSGGVKECVFHILCSLSVCTCGTVCMRVCAYMCMCEFMCVCMRIQV